MGDTTEKLAEFGVLGAVLLIALFGIYKLWRAYVAVQMARVEDQKETTKLLVDLNSANLAVLGKLTTEIKTMHMMRSGGPPPST